MERWARLSGCKKYRYSLLRTWDESKSECMFIMLNPSTADGTQDDPTVRRCISFAKSWGHGGLTIVNLFALRATDPKDLHQATDPVGTKNDWWIAEAVAETKGPIICAWGASPFPHKYQSRDHDVMQLICPSERPLACLGTTKTGRPRHPLFVKSDRELSYL